MNKIAGIQRVGEEWFIFCNSKKDGFEINNQHVLNLMEDYELDASRVKITQDRFAALKLERPEFAHLYQIIRFHGEENVIQDFINDAISQNLINKNFEISNDDMSVLGLGLEELNTVENLRVRA